MNVCAHTRLAELTAALPGLPTVAGTEPERMRATGTYDLRTGVQDRPRQRQHRERGSARSGAEWRRETGAARETGDAQENLVFKSGAARRGKTHRAATNRGVRTPIELFVDGVGVWEPGIGPLLAGNAVCGVSASPRLRPFGGLGMSNPETAPMLRDHEWSVVVSLAASIALSDSSRRMARAWTGSRSRDAGMVRRMTSSSARA